MGFLSRVLHTIEDNNIPHEKVSKILNEALLKFGERCLVSYAKSYNENPKGFIRSFINYPSIRSGCIWAIAYAKKSGIYKEIEGKKDFSEWVSKQPLDERWKPVLNNFLIILWGINQ